MLKLNILAAPAEVSRLIVHVVDVGGLVASLNGRQLSDNVERSQNALSNQHVHAFQSQEVREPLVARSVSGTETAEAVTRPAAIGAEIVARGESAAILSRSTSVSQ